VLWGAQFAAAEHPDGMTATQIAAARPPYLGGQSAGTRPGDPVWEPAPPAQLTERERLEAFRRYAALAADLAAVALWTSGGRVGTIPDLAERLLAPPLQVRTALSYAAQEHLISVDGDPGDASAHLTLTVLAPRDEHSDQGSRFNWL
jgi:hypothetical protein